LPDCVAFLKGTSARTLIGAVAIVLAVALFTLNFSVSCLTGRTCGETSFAAVAGGFPLLFGLISMPLTFALWLLVRANTRS
jgi:hypothetical protein